MKLYSNSFVKATVVNLAITAIWYFYEYGQFGELQWNRKCDNMVGMIYFFLTWYLFYKIEKGKKNDEDKHEPTV